MSKVFIPAGYHSCLSLYDTQKAIGLTKTDPSDRCLFFPDRPQAQRRPHRQKHRQKNTQCHLPVFLPVGPEAGEGKMIQG